MRDMTEEQRARYEEAYSAAYNASMQTPKAWFPHDTDAHRDTAVRRVVRSGGIEMYGWYWLLVELLTLNKGQGYDVTDDEGWDMLAADMSVLAPVDAEEAKRIVAEFARVGLLCSQELEDGYVVSHRVARNYIAAATSAARKAGGGVLGGRPKKP